MGRLIPQALYSHSRQTLDYVKARLSGIDPFADLGTHQDIWEKAAKRIKKIDPNGNRSYDLLRELENKR